MARKDRINMNLNSITFSFQPKNYERILGIDRRLSLPKPFFFIDKFNLG